MVRMSHLHAWVKDDGVWHCDLCPQVYGEPEVEVNGPPLLGGRQQAVHDVLVDGDWHSGPELCHPRAGGSEGLRRVRELRAKGAIIEKRLQRKGNTTREYRLIGWE